VGVRRQQNWLQNRKNVRLIGDILKIREFVKSVGGLKMLERDVVVEKMNAQNFIDEIQEIIDDYYSKIADDGTASDVLCILTKTLVMFINEVKRLQQRLGSTNHADELYNKAMRHLEGEVEWAENHKTVDDESESFVSFEAFNLVVNNYKHLYQTY
jgi:uncharacterized protein (UPF0305 family)